MTREEKIICKEFLNDADKTHSCNEYKLLMALLEQEPTTKNDLGVSSGLKNASPFIDWNNCHTSEQLDSISTTKNDLGVDCISRQATINAVKRIHPVDTDYDCTLYDKVDVMYVLDELPSVTSQEPILEKINKMKSEIASSLEFWDYSPNNNPLARDMLETITHFWGDMRGEEY